MSVKKILLDAAEHIKTYGWCKGHVRLYPDDGVLTGKYPACAIGAIFYAAGVYSDYGYVSGKYFPAADYFEGFIYNKYGVRSISDWNDSPSTTKEDVIAAFELAAELYQV